MGSEMCIRDRSQAQADLDKLTAEKQVLEAKVRSHVPDGPTRGGLCGGQREESESRS